jgi:hypothetical protein
MPAIFGPQAILTDADKALHSDFANARCHTACFHWLAPCQWILAFDARITGNALF